MPLFTATFDPAWATVGLVVDGSLWPAPGVRTNLVTNPSLGVDATGWSVTGGTGTRVAQGAGWAWQADGSVTTYLISPPCVGLAGQFFSGSVVVSGPAGRTVRVQIQDGVGAITSIPVPVLTGAPQTVTLTSSAAATGTVPRIYVNPTATGGAWTAGQMLTVTNALIEQVSGVGVAPGAYFDGDTLDVPPSVYAWSGAANASTSTETTYAITNITITRQVAGEEDIPVRGVESLPVLGGYFVGSDPEAPLESTVTYRIDGYLAAVFVQSATAAVDTTGAANGLWVKVPGDPNLTILAKLRAISDITSPTVGGVYQIIGGGTVSQSVASWSGVESDQGSVSLSVAHPAGTERLRAALAAARVLLLQPIGSTDLDAGFYFVANVSRSNPAQVESFVQRWFNLSVQRVGVPAGDGQGIPGWTCAAVLDTYATCALMLAAKATCFDLLQGV